MLLPAGHRFGRYVVAAPVGEGGMGVVYRAWDEVHSRTVALKVLRSDTKRGDSGSSGAESVARFVREARLAGSLDHPAVVAVLDAGAVGDAPYLAMEWLDGLPLAVAVRDPRFDIIRRLAVLRDVAEALAYAHARGVVHRDVKPGNVMVGPDGRAKLLDFGIAKRTRPADDPGTMLIATEAHVLLGTPRYMAPEQLVSASVDARADQFSWAVMAYEVLAGVHPRETVIGATAFPLGRARPLAEIQPLVPQSVCATVHRALAYDPHGRFASMEELLAAMVGLLPAPADPTNPSGSVTAATTGQPVVLPVPASPPPFVHVPVGASLPPTGRAPRARSPWLFAALGAGAFAVLAGVGVVALVAVRAAPAVASPVVASGPGALVVTGPDSDVQFEGDPSALERLRGDLASKLSPCLDAQFAGEMSLRIDLEILPDGRVGSVSDLSMCKDATPGVHLCGDPTKAEVACITPHARSLRFPRLRGAGGKAEPVSATLAVKRR